MLEIPSQEGCPESQVLTPAVTRPVESGMAAGWAGSGGAASVEAAGGPQVSHRCRAPAQRIEQQAQVVVRVGEVGIGGEGPMVRRDRLGAPAHLLEQATQVEVRDGVARRVVD